MRRLRPDIVHTHTSKAGFSGRIAARLARVPVVVHTFHGHAFSGYFSPPVTRALLALERTLSRVTDSVVTVSDTLKQQLVTLRVAPREKIEVIELGLDLDPFLSVSSRSGMLRREIGAAEETLVGIVGRLVPIKDHRTFLEAAALISRRRPDVRFVIVGDGELRATLETHARELDLAKRVHFVGWKAELAPVYADLDVVVLSSRNEGTPVSLIEAAAAGRPVVATRVGGVPDVIEDGVSGRLVPPGDPASLARAIEELLDAPQQARLFAAEGRERVRRRFTRDRLVADVERLYVRLLSRKGILLQGLPGCADGIGVR